METSFVRSWGKKKPPDTHLAWLGGLIDGEGTIYCVFRNLIDKRNVRPRVCVYNTQRILLDTIIRRFKIGRIYFHRRAPHRENRRLMAYEWRINNEEAIWLLPLVRPWLILKIKQCDIVIRVLKLKERLYPVPGRIMNEKVNQETIRLAYCAQALNRRGLIKVTTAGPLPCQK